MWALLATSVNKMQDMTISQRQQEINYAQLLGMLTGSTTTLRALTKHLLCKTTRTSITENSEFNKL
jgi:uncharacterized transporter YbjL